MPLYALASSGLYNIPDLPVYLAELGYTPASSGLEKFRHVLLGRNYRRTHIFPSTRTVERMLLDGILVKYVTCESILEGFNLERPIKNLPILPLTVIAEHEWLVEGAKKMLTQIARERRESRSKIRIDISLEVQKPVQFVNAMFRGARTTSDRCQAFIGAIEKLYGGKLTMTNNPKFPLRAAPLLDWPGTAKESK